MNEMKQHAQFITTTFRPELLDAGDKVKKNYSVKSSNIFYKFYFLLIIVGSV